MILPIKKRVDGELLRQRKQTPINKYTARENKNRVDYDYKVGDKVMLLNHTAYKYETRYKVPFVITKCFTDGSAMLQYGSIQITYIIGHIKPYKSDTKVEYFNPKKMDAAVNI